MDFHIMNTIGVENADQNLITAAAAQKRLIRVVTAPTQSSRWTTPALMPGGDGYAGFSRMFAMQTATA
jgi:hypothetical protein